MKWRPKGDLLASGDKTAVAGTPLAPSTVQEQQPQQQQYASDLGLASAILARDRKAMARLVELHTDAVHKYVWRRLAPKIDMVDDLVQDVFIAAWRSLAGYSASASLETWLLSIARHKVEDHYRRTLGGPLQALEGNDSAADVVDEAPDPESALAQNRQAEDAAEALSKLPYEYAAVLRWRYWDGRSAREMAAASGRTEKAVERLLARARERFRQQWLSKTAKAGAAS